MITVDDGPVPVALRASTRYVTTRDEKGNREDLRDGMRVVIKLDAQGRAAEEVRYRLEPRNEQHGGTGDDASN